MECNYCGNVFTPKGKYKQYSCSKKCQTKHYRKQVKINNLGKYRHECEKCGKVFNDSRKRGRFCSVDCMINANIFIINGITFKRCIRCGDIRVREDNFYKKLVAHKATWSDYETYCKQCNYDKQKIPSGIISRKKSRDKGRGRDKIRQFEYRQNPEVKQRRNKQELEQKKSDPNFALRCRMRILMYASLRVVKNGKKWQELVGYSVDDLRDHIEKLFIEGMSWELFMQGKIHIDHKYPVSKFNYTSPDDESFKQCWALDNLQPLWGVDNLRKGNKIG